MKIDIYRGPGGWDQGASMLGVTDIDGIDNDPNAHATAIAAGHGGQLADITTLDPRNYLGEPIELELASPPCPGFSIAGKGDGRKDLELLLKAVADLGRGIDPAAVLGMVRAWQRDERSALVLEPLHWALILHPRAIAFEQVPAVLPVWEVCATVLREQGYNVWSGMVYAEQHGVPQTRKRAVLLASLDRPVERPTATHSKYYINDPQKLDDDVEKWISMAEALGWGMTHRPSMTVTGGGIASGGAEPFGNAARKGIMREAEAGRFRVRTSMGTPKVDGRNGTHELDPFNRPAHTVTTKSGEWRVVPGDLRITVQEAALLQTFPADYPWSGGLGQRYQQIGNAVPPLLAAHLIASLGVGTLPAANQLTNAA